MLQADYRNRTGVVGLNVGLRCIRVRSRRIGDILAARMSAVRLLRHRSFRCAMRAPPHHWHAQHRRVLCVARFLRDCSDQREARIKKKSASVTELGARKRQPMNCAWLIVIGCERLLDRREQLIFPHRLSQQG